MKAIRLTLGLLLAIAAQSANSASISFDQESYSGEFGALITVIVNYDFTDQAAYGVGASLLYDSIALEFVSYVPVLTGAAQLNLPGTLVAPGQYLDFGMNTKFFGGINDAWSIGIFTFSLLANVSTTDTPCGQALCLTSSAIHPAVDLFGQDLTDIVFAGQDGLSADARLVPLPAGAWLLFSGLAAAAAFFRKSKLAGS